MCLGLPRQGAGSSPPALVILLVEEKAETGREKKRELGVVRSLMFSK